MMEKRFEFREATITGMKLPYVFDVEAEEYLTPLDCVERLNALHDECLVLKCARNGLKKENERLKSQLYCDDEEGVCNICKHHYLVKDDELELGYYNSRCRKGHYECARVSLKYCKDWEEL